MQLRPSNFIACTVLLLAGRTIAAESGVDALREEVAHATQLKIVHLTEAKRTTVRVTPEELPKYTADEGASSGVISRTARPEVFLNLAAALKQTRVLGSGVPADVRWSCTLYSDGGRRLGGFSLGKGFAGHVLGRFNDKNLTVNTPLLGWFHHLHLQASEN